MPGSSAPRPWPGLWRRRHSLLTLSLEDAVSLSVVWASKEEPRGGSVMGGRAWESRGESGREILQLLEVGTERLPVLTTSNTGNQTPWGPTPTWGW